VCFGTGAGSFGCGNTAAHESCAFPYPLSQLDTKPCTVRCRPELAPAAKKKQAEDELIAIKATARDEAAAATAAAAAAAEAAASEATAAAADTKAAASTKEATPAAISLKTEAPISLKKAAPAPTEAGW